MAQDSSINSFIGAFGELGPAKANKFRVEFTLPRGIEKSGVFTNTNSESGKISSIQSQLNGRGQINLMCHTCTLPMRDLSGAEIAQFGPPFRMPFSASYTPVSFTFYSGADLAVRKYFETWQTAVTNISSNTFNFYNEYTADVRINVLDAEMNEVYYVDLYECWPSNVSMIDYSYSNTDALQNVATVLQYKYWQSGDDDTRVAKTV